MKRDELCSCSTIHSDYKTLQDILSGRQYIGSCKIRCSCSITGFWSVQLSVSEKERCSLDPMALFIFFPPHNLLWIPDLLLIIFEEGAIHISYILPVSFFLYWPETTNKLLLLFLNIIINHGSSVSVLSKSSLKGAICPRIWQPGQPAVYTNPPVGNEVLAADKVT